MSSEQFIESISEFERWKNSIATELTQFKEWLNRNQLTDNEHSERIQNMQDALNTEYLTIAFAGEFSRGKTELINAIFFADYGQRILPSQAGRTTMCPTELFFDNRQQKNYLKLLPIETRLQDIPMSEYRDSQDYWVEIPLRTDTAEDMESAMQNITHTKTVSRVDALALGFDASMLDESEEYPDKVEIPAWRHAMVSFSHPLLRQGLRILDTPGLNALGSEPELTFNLLPQAQAVVFVLAADAGVTASDLQVWEEHIEQLKTRPNLGLYAVLNKIDVLWDELSGKKKTEKAINRVIRQTARHLKIPDEDILPVSAHKALVGKVKQDKSLLLRSQIEDVENVLSSTILGNKEKAMWESILEQSTHLIQDSQQVLKARRDQLAKQHEELVNVQGDQESELKQLLDSNNQTQAEFKKRYLTLKPSQRLLERQSEILTNVISKNSLEEINQKIMHDLVASKTSIGMMRTIKRYFQAIDNVMAEYCREAELSNKMAESMYLKFEHDFEIELLPPRPLKAKSFRRELQHILDESSQLNRNILLTLTEQSVAVQRFFTTTVNNITMFFKKVRTESRQWSRDVISPLVRQVNSLRDLLENKHNELLSLQQNEATIEGRLKALNSLMNEIEAELQKSADSLKALHAKAPSKANTNVVNLASARR